MVLLPGSAGGECEALKLLGAHDGDEAASGAGSQCGLGEGRSQAATAAASAWLGLIMRVGPVSPLWLASVASSTCAPVELVIAFDVTLSLGLMRQSA